MIAGWIGVQEIEESKQFNECCKGSNIGGLDIMAEAK